MWSLLLEAGLAMFVLVFIVWWTMFSGRKGHSDMHAATKSKADAAGTIEEDHPPP